MGHLLNLSKGNWEEETLTFSKGKVDINSHSNTALRYIFFCDLILAFFIFLHVGHIHFSSLFKMWEGEEIKKKR